MSVEDYQQLLDLSMENNARVVTMTSTAAEDCQQLLETLQNLLYNDDIDLEVHTPDLQYPPPTPGSQLELEDTESQVFEMSFDSYDHKLQTNRPESTSCLSSLLLSSDQPTTDSNDLQHNSENLKDIEVISISSQDSDEQLMRSTTKTPAESVHDLYSDESSKHSESSNKLPDLTAIDVRIIFDSHSDEYFRNSGDSSRHSGASSRHSDASSRHSSAGSKHSSAGSKHSSAGSSHSGDGSSDSSDSSSDSGDSSRHSGNSSRHSGSGNSSRHSSNSTKHSDDSSRHSGNSSRHSDDSSRHSDDSSRHSDDSSSDSSDSSSDSSDSSSDSGDSSRHSDVSSRHSDDALRHSDDILRDVDEVSMDSDDISIHFDESSWNCDNSSMNSDKTSRHPDSQSSNEQLLDSTHRELESIYEFHSDQISVMSDDASMHSDQNSRYPDSQSSKNQVADSTVTAVVNISDSLSDDTSSHSQNSRNQLPDSTGTDIEIIDDSHLVYLSRDLDTEIEIIDDSHLVYLSNDLDTDTEIIDDSHLVYLSRDLDDTSRHSDSPNSKEQLTDLSLTPVESIENSYECTEHISQVALETSYEFKENPTLDISNLSQSEETAQEYQINGSQSINNPNDSYNPPSIKVADNHVGIYNSNSAMAASPPVTHLNTIISNFQNFIQNTNIETTTANENNQKDTYGSDTARGADETTLLDKDLQRNVGSLKREREQLSDEDLEMPEGKKLCRGAEIEK